MACVNKKDKDLASSIYSIMCEYDDVNLVVLEEMLRETGEVEVIKQFVNNRNLQNKYFEQLIEAEIPEVSEQVTPKKRLIFKPKNK